jgi:hypothetical protein
VRSDLGLEMMEHSASSNKLHFDGTLKARRNEQEIELETSTHRMVVIHAF